MEFIKWDIKSIGVEKDIGFSPEITATIQASSPFGVYVNPRELHAELQNRLNLTPMYKPDIKKVVFNDPATIVFWADGTKTVVKAQDEKFDPEKGLAMAIAKKALGNKGNYFNEIKKWVGDYEERKSMREACRKMLVKIGVIKPANAYEGLLAVYRNKKASKAELRKAVEDALNYLTPPKSE